MKNIFHLTILITFTSLLFSCSTVPGTGRSQFTPIPSSTMMSMSSGEYSKVIKQAKLSEDKEKVAMVRRVGKKIAAAVDQLLQEEGTEMKFDWEFNLIVDDKQANAWCMPGGKIAVYTGILKYTKDETGLAVVMGHEVAHAVAKHGNERMAQGLGISLISIALAVSLNEQDPTTRNIFLGAFGAGAQYGVLLPFGRHQETEADKLGVQLMARAGYDPYASIAFWERMAKASGGKKPPEFLSTHPSNETRIRNLETFIPEAAIYYFP
ncbi:MAG: M48 family metallopeptidase [Lentisphaeraceae bacterium]|nr:M48 family metallopeptidase [Lentisphaeraceae bacterium]